MRKSAPVLSIFQFLLPQGWLFFNSTMSPTAKYLFSKTIPPHCGMRALSHHTPPSLIPKVLCAGILPLTDKLEEKGLTLIMCTAAKSVYATPSFIPVRMMRTAAVCCYIPAACLQYSRYCGRRMFPGGRSYQGLHTGHGLVNVGRGP